MVVTPDHLFEPGFSIEGAYEVFGDDELLHGGSLSEGDYVEDENSLLRAIVEDEGDTVVFKGLHGVAIHGSPEQFQWATIEIFRDGNAIAEIDVEYDCKAVMKGCPQHGKVCTPQVLEMGTE